MINASGDKMFFTIQLSCHTFANFWRGGMLSDLGCYGCRNITDRLEWLWRLERALCGFSSLHVPSHFFFDVLDNDHQSTRLQKWNVL